MRRAADQSGKSNSMRQGGGFSLIELLIVVAIILIIAAIAIPNFMRARITANEAAAVASCRNITTAEVVYSSTYNIGYSAGLPELGPPPPGTPVSASRAGLIDDVLASTVKGGYVFTYRPTDTDGNGTMDTYTLNADPTNPGVTGYRRFYTDPSGVIRFNQASKASASDSPIG